MIHHRPPGPLSFPGPTRLSGPGHTLSPMSNLPNSLPAAGRALRFPLDAGDELDSRRITSLAWGGEAVTVELEDGTRARYLLDLFPGGGGRWVLDT